jgi:hypothetical protein
VFELAREAVADERRGRHGQRGWQMFRNLAVISQLLWPWWQLTSYGANAFTVAVGDTLGHLGTMYTYNYLKLDSTVR